VLILPVEEAKVGMTLAAPVKHPDDPDHDLLKYGYVMEQEVLDRLKSIGVEMIFVDFPGLDDLDRHLAVNLSPERQKIYQQIKQTVIANQKRSRPAVSYSDYYSTTRDLITTLMSQGQHPVYIEHLSRLGTDAVTHAAAVAHLSLMLGIKLEMYLIQQRKRLPAHHAKEVVNLGVAGMLHDMGKLSLPEDLQKYTGINPPTDPEELKRWQEHTSLGYESVRGEVEPSAAAAIMHHHQRWDGTGFPLTVNKDGTSTTPKEERIHIFARMMAAADLYDRLATPMDKSPRRSNLEILHLLRTKYAGWCDPMVLKALQEIVPPFPPGAIVRLSDNTSAVVVNVDPKMPFKPSVKKIIGEDMKLAEDPLNLAKPGAPRITHIGKTAVDGLMPAGPSAV
jgi:HD-GYP domain-containing protein (c-di-GMP phosphodiesterase class II)